MRRLIVFLEARSRLLAAGVVLLLVLLAVLMELMSSPAFPSELFYLPPIVLAAWYGGRLPAILLIAASGTVWLLLYPGGRATLWHGLTHFILFLLIALMISSFRALYRAEQHRSGTDSLTGLANGWAFRERLEEEFARAKRYGHPTTLLYIDVDNFKHVNDRWGHAAGDDLLRQIGGVLEEALRRTDVAARIGGDEFAVLLTETGEEGAARTASAIRDSLMHTMRRAEYPVTFSIGVAIFPESPAEAEEALRFADDLMYRAKYGGKDQIVAERAT